MVWEVVLSGVIFSGVWGMMGWGIAKVAQTTMNKMTSMKKWKGQPAGEYSFGVVPTGAKVPQRTTLSSFEGKPLVIHFYSDG